MPGLLSTIMSAKVKDAMHTVAKSVLGFVRIWLLALPRSA